jgi:ATP-binding cassette subfamily B (MDR/TAP) protein 1
VDLRQYNLRWLRSQMGLVSQEPLLFSASIMDNIRYGKPGATPQEVRAGAAPGPRRGGGTAAWRPP